MFGWINDCMEKLVISQYGIEKWHEIKSKAGCQVSDNGFVRHQLYPDDSTVQLVVAASEILGLSVDEVLEAFGVFFMEFTRGEGFENLLQCQGSTLRTWLSNLNALHDHLESSFPPGMVKPVFWCEDDDNEEGCIIVHYYSKRGNLLVPLVVGLVKEVARFHFDVKVEMQMIQKQAVEGASHTSWRVKAVDAKESWKITIREASHVSETSTPKLRNGVKCPFTGAEIHQDVNPVIPESTESTCHEPFISGQQMKSIFPYHIVFDQLFVILQIGSALPGLMNVKESDLVGCHMEDILCITKPVLGTWDWKALKKLEDQTFFLEPVHDSLGFVKFKANVVRLSDPSGSAMLFLSPDVKNVHEMNAMNLTMTDLPLHSFQRDAVLLGEHIVSEVKSSHKLDRLSKKLQHEQTLSNALLHSVLPPHVAGELRAGKTVDPELHDEVTLFFSDVVGFTSICENIFPWDCVDLLNRLYCVMDFLAGRFKLYKIETIGDSYLCCAGLPTADPKHAERVANFALAVRHCSQLVMNPVDGLPIQLRIGLHSGPCMTGVVGMTTPRYCVFGDTVNTASRHESTGIPGKIQCSSITYGKLAHFSEGRYEFTPRGLVEMKGKGLMATYFLEGSDNTQVSSAALDQLYSEVENMLANRKFSNKRYFKRYGRRASETCFGTTESNTSETLDQSQEEE